jgi:uncharacterized membrane protein YqjE
MALLLVELAEERQRVVQAVVFGFVAVFLVVLAGMTLTAGIVVAFWKYSPLLALGGITVVYLGVAGLLVWRIKELFKGRAVLPSSVEQIRRDAALVDGCLRQVLTDPARETRAA